MGGQPLWRYWTAQLPQPMPDRRCRTMSGWWVIVRMARRSRRPSRPSPFTRRWPTLFCTSSARARVCSTVRANSEPHCWVAPRFRCKSTPDYSPTLSSTSTPEACLSARPRRRTCWAAKFSMTGPTVAPSCSPSATPMTSAGYRAASRSSPSTPRWRSTASARSMSRESARRCSAGSAGTPTIAPRRPSTRAGCRSSPCRHKTNGRSPLVTQLSRPVSTPAYDVDLIVTENGHADLRGADWTTRAQLITALFE